MLGNDLVLFLALQARLASLSLAVLPCCLLVGMVASLVEVFRGCSSVDCVVRGFLPVACAWFSGLSGLLGSCFWSFLPHSSSGCGCFAGLLFCSSCACLVSSGTAASRMLTVVLALGGLSGCSPLGVLPPRFPPCCLLPLWVVSTAAWELASHFFPLPFPLESLSLHGSWSGFCRGSPLRVVSSCSFLRVACLRSGGGGLGWQSLAGPYILRDVYLVPVRISPLLLLRYTGSFRRSRCACLGLRPFGKCV